MHCRNIPSFALDVGKSAFLKRFAYAIPNLIVQNPASTVFEPPINQNLSTLPLPFWLKQKQGYLISLLDLFEILKIKKTLLRNKEKHLPTIQFSFQQTFNIMQENLVSYFTESTKKVSQFENLSSSKNLTNPKDSEMFYSLKFSNRPKKLDTNGNLLKLKHI